MKYYKDSQNKIYVDPILENHTGLIEITEAEAKSILAPLPLTPEEKMNDITVAIQTHLDEQAQALRYDNMTSARAYTGYLNAFVVEATELAEWCAECWTYAGVVENDVMNGLREIPTPEEAIAELPKFRAVV